MISQTAAVHELVQIIGHVAADQIASECTGNANTCPIEECMLCGVRDCPNNEPLHYHHDGCPACSEESN